MPSLKNAHSKVITIIFLFFVILKTSPAYSQVQGCTDSTANNYDPSATANDGSCNYNVTNYTPPVVVDTISETLKESSGLQWAGNSLWSFNDRNGTPDLYRIDTASNAILQTVRLTGATNVDWEEITFDGTHFYVGDFGNNLNGARTNLKIYKFAYNLIPDYTTHPEAAIPVDKIEVINFTYNDQPQPPVQAPLDSTKFDCEALVVDGGKIHLFTKDWIDFTSTHYVINSTLAGSYVAAPVDTLDAGYLVTAASKAPGREVITLLGYVNGGFGNHYMHLLSGYSDGSYFNGNKRKINLPAAPEMGQAEGITFRNDEYGYMSNERLERSTGFGDIIVSQKLRSFNISSFVPSNVLAVQLQNFSATKTNAADKIVWKFSSPVHRIQIQQSFDGVRFITLKTYDVSAEGSYYHKPVNAINYYRIEWKENNGTPGYSKIISIKNEDSKQITHVLLKANGELSFMSEGSVEEYFSFKLHTPDGKEISRIAKRSYQPGLNKINFTGGSALNGVVLLTAYGSNQKWTRAVHVAE